MKKQDFIKQYLPLAQKAGVQFGMNPVIILAQSAIETGWGESTLCKEHNNFFRHHSLRSSQPFLERRPERFICRHRPSDLMVPPVRFTGRQFPRLRPSDPLCLSCGSDSHLPPCGLRQRDCLQQIHQRSER